MSHFRPEFLSLLAQVHIGLGPHCHCHGGQRLVLPEQLGSGNCPGTRKDDVGLPIPILVPMTVNTSVFPLLVCNTSLDGAKGCSAR